MQTLAKINNVPIQMANDGSKMIPIKPICEALGVDPEGQRQRIERDEILSSVAFIIKAVGADKKEREMFCIPLKFSFGWLFTIDTSRVNEDARKSVIKYKLQCYDVLYRHFTEQEEFMQERQEKINEKILEYDNIRAEYRETEKRLRQAKADLYAVKDMTIEEWRNAKIQTELEFEPEEGDSSFRSRSIRNDTRRWACGKKRRRRMQREGTTPVCRRRTLLPQQRNRHSEMQ
jgi:hypothetical protein